MRGGSNIYPIILAAGPARGLAVPPALARLGRRTALQIAVENCAGLKPAILVLGSQAAQVRRFVPPGVRVVVNRHWRRGQHSSLLAGLRRAPRAADFLLYPVDYPRLTAEIIRRLAEAFGRRRAGQDITAPRYRGRSGHPVIFAAALRREMERAKTAREVVYADTSRVQYVNVNTPVIWQDADAADAIGTSAAKAAGHSKRLDAGLKACSTQKQVLPCSLPWVTPGRNRGRAGRPPDSRQDAGATDGARLADLRSYLNEVRDGLPVTRERALRLIACGEDELPDLLETARYLKERFKPHIVTYSRKVFLPLTNLCRDYCGYCIFRRDPGQPGARTMTPDEVLAVARAGQQWGCREALFSLGDKPEMAFAEMRATLRRLGYRSTLHYLEAMCELVLRETALIPHANPGLMSAHWLKRLRAVSPSLGLMLESTSRALLRRGAAHDNAPDKPPELRLGTIEAAGRQNIPFTTGLLIGIGETLRDRVDSLFAILELHRRYGHIQEVIIQNFRVKDGIPMSARPEPGRGEMLRAIAVARLVLRDMNIQAPPNLSAPDYQELLSAGINDWGGVSPLTPDYINPERPWPHLEELTARTAAAGFVLKQRLPVYPEFLPRVRRAGGLAAERTLAAADQEGYAKPPQGSAGILPAVGRASGPPPAHVVGSIV